MSANRFNGFTEFGIGIGIGLRIPHYNHILTKRPALDWFEIPAGSTAPIRILSYLRRCWS